MAYVWMTLTAGITSVGCSTRPSINAPTTSASGKETPKAESAEVTPAEAVEIVYRVPEVKEHCKRNAPRCTHLIEERPATNCRPDDSDKTRCAWLVSIRTIQPAGPHMAKFADFYVDERGHISVAPIQIGEVVSLDTWRCLQRHDFEVTSCKTPQE